MSCCIVEVKDKVLEILTEANVNVEYMYAFLGRKEGKALMVLKADDEAAAEYKAACRTKIGE